MSDHKEKISNIPEVEIPNFEPSIPESMLNNVKDKSTKHLLGQLSIMMQNNDWQNKKIKDIYDYTRNINGKVIELEEFRVETKQDKAVKDAVVRTTRRLKSKTSKHYKIALVLFLVVIYPLFLTQWDPASSLMLFIKDIF